jgi:glycosyltransferase involved in cell wall biosynthesis
VQVLAVAPYVPYPGVPHAGGEYLLRHLEALSGHHQVTLLAPGSDEALAHAQRAPAWLDLVVPPLRLSERSTARWLADAAYRRAMGVPPAPSAESLRAVRSAELVARAARADVVELHWPEYARFASELRRAGVTTPVAVVEHDVDVDANARRLREYGTGYRRRLGLLTAPLPRRWEVRGLRDADLVLVFKGEDELVLRRAGVQTRVRVIDPWVEEPTDPVQRTPRQALFAGAMWRRENADGAVWFLQQVWPRVRQRVPAASFVIAGAAPGPELLAAAAAADGVQVTGEVPSLLPSYARASLFVSPMFVGGGLKFKVAQAMRCGLPVVATTNAAQGIVGHAPPEALWAVTDDPAAMAARIVEAFEAPEQAAATGARAADWAAGRWSFSRSLEEVVADYETLIGGAPSGR